jgi:VanZ family protein
MVVIFYFSSQPANISDANSDFAIRLLNFMGIDLNSTFGSLSTFIVRKAAHFTEYSILFILLYISIREDYNIKMSIFLAVIIVFSYACTDEFHQTFVQGREGRFRDVLIDTSGGIVMSLIICICYHLRKKLHK